MTRWWWWRRARADLAQDRLTGADKRIQELLHKTHPTWSELGTTEYEFVRLGSAWFLRCCDQRMRSYEHRQRVRNPGLEQLGFHAPQFERASMIFICAGCGRWLSRAIRKRGPWKVLLKDS